MATMANGRVSPVFTFRHSSEFTLDICLGATFHFQSIFTVSKHAFKDKDYCPIEIIKGLTDKGQFQYLTKLMGPQEGTYLYATQFHSLR